MAERKRVVIIGGGFGGLEAAKKLAKAPVEVLLLDRKNHHTFQPLLYQVATAALSPADIASPIRHILHKQANCRVALAHATAIDAARKVVVVEGGEIPYDWLILAAGATHSYFGRDDWEHLAPGLKSVEDATTIRTRLLLAFEDAEYEVGEEGRRAALTFAIVGGGPTGVELAGAIKEIAAKAIPADFRNIDTKTARVLLLQGGDRLLPGLDPSLGERAKKDLEKLGVEVMLNSRVTGVTEGGVTIGDEFVPARNVLWAAGVKANPIGRTLGAPLDRSGRVMVAPDLTVPGAPGVFVIGDMAAAEVEPGKPVPGVAPAAIQMGKHAAKLIAAEARGEVVPPDRRKFVYRDKGTLATIGRGRAVAQIGRLKFGGLLAWLLWACVHVLSLVNFRNRTAVLFNWAWQLFTFGRGARLITGDPKIPVAIPGPGPKPTLASFSRSPGS
ncbi:NADH dehydrogenase [Aquisphaera giovannonii]|uniref:NADH:ubiquinone reductase (non-electrogenic) n=1 Tax=Aquisphaera giovannonii TaxID=406548 RepID=A0A5B9WB91_9BACT|nr:NAD(P)/FAD-dependent oxidoreductase [Aquisphaera giovannonii]QEH37150.1 NADH dehydrogenase [Aquisphaera giovannonii]